MEEETIAKMAVIGIGGSGGKVINSMRNKGLKEIELIAIDSDTQDLQASLASNKFLCKEDLLIEFENRGSKAQLKKLLSDCDFACIIAGMGGKTGTNLAPIIAQLAKDCGVLTAVLASRPFRFEGWERRKKAGSMMEMLEQQVDILIQVTHPKLLSLYPEARDKRELFLHADDYCYQLIKTFRGLLTPGFIRIDLDDISSFLKNKGTIFTGFGTGASSKQAAKLALTSLFLDDVNLAEAKFLLIHIASSSNLGILEVYETTQTIQDHVHEDVNLIFGWTVDESVDESVSITIFATETE